MLNSGYDPVNVNDFEKSKLSFSGQGIYFECSENAEASQDLVLADDYLLTGGTLIVKGGDLHDKVYLQVIHPQAGLLSEFVSGFRVIGDQQKQFDLQLPYPAKIPGGLSLRCKFVAGATVGVRDIAVNFYLHKVLV